jgi:flagellar basal-body rod protein FlgF
MDLTAISAAAGLRSRMEALDILSNNLANATTGGFKLDREFYSLFQGQSGLPRTGGSNATLPVIQKQWTDFKQGTLQPTGNPLDLALEGKGFFAVNGPSSTLYTRNGAFKLSPAGVLTTLDGYAVRAVGGKPIQAQGTGPIEVSSDGTVQQAGQALGQLELVDFADMDALGKVGNSYFRVTDVKAKPVAAAAASVAQGRIEGSNVAPAESAVRLVELMRQYEMLQKAVTVAADMNRKAMEDVARVGS